MRTGRTRGPSTKPNLRVLDAAELLYIEQPLAPDELVGHARLSPDAQDPGVSRRDAARRWRGRARWRTSTGPKVWNLKVHRVGGLTEAIAVYREAMRYGAALWAGTVPESGIGSQADLAVAALPGFVYPSDLEPSTRWYGRNVDVIKLVMARERDDAGARALGVPDARPGPLPGRDAQARSRPPASRPPFRA